MRLAARKQALPDEGLGEKQLNVLLRPFLGRK